MAALSYLRIRDWPYPQLGATLLFELRQLADGEFVIQASALRPTRPRAPAVGHRGLIAPTASVSI
eukprot:1178164-Prorocentrum_minimum.AAC.4